MIAEARPIRGSRQEVAVSGVLVRVLADAVQAYGIAPGALLSAEHHALLSGDPMEKRVALNDFHAMFERAVALTGEAALGLRCGLESNVASFDLFAPLVSHVSSLRHAISESQHFHGLILEGIELRLSERLGVARLQCGFPRLHGPFDRSVEELLVAGLLRMIQVFGCGDAELLAVCFADPPPAYRHRYAAAFGGKERFGTGKTAIDFRAEILDRAYLHSSPELHKQLHSQAERCLARMVRSLTFAERLREHLYSRATWVPDMDVAARELGICTRSLRRRLVAEGVSYRALTQTVLKDRACTMLRSSAYSVQEIAYQLGFSSPTAFHRAFKRWTGSTPTAYRGRANTSFIEDAKARTADGLIR